MNLHFLLRAFVELYARPFLFKTSGCRVYHRERLPADGPAIIVANHASLVDAMLIQFLYPGSMLSSVRPTGARDFFQRSVLGYFAATHILRMCFVDRGSGNEAKAGKDIFAELRSPLAAGQILVFFPQGTRKAGAPFETGIFHLARSVPHVPIIPVRIEGTREMMPAGTRWPRAHPITVYVGKPYPLDPALSPREYARRLQEHIASLAAF